MTKGCTVQERPRNILLVAVLLAVLALPALPALAQEPPTESQTYVVQPGDTLAEIALRFGTSVDALVAANGIADPRLIVPGQKLIIPAAGPTPQPTAGPQTYVVQPGDTLAAIAQRFGTTVQALVSANSIADPALISVGQKLVIPAGTGQPAPVSQPQPTYLRTHTVRSGETLPFLAFRYGTTTWALLANNTLGPLGLLRLGQDLSIPQPTAATAAMPRFPEIVLKPAPVVQGQTLAVQVQSSRPLELSGQFLEQDLSFVAGEGGDWALVGVGVLTKAGVQSLRLAAVEQDTGDRLSVEEPVDVVAGSFSRVNVVVPADRQGLLDPTLSQKESKKVNQVFALASAEQLWQGAFSPPLVGDMPVSAGFGQQRSYNGGPATNYHAGEDIDVEAGTRVIAPAGGTVVLAEKLQVRGNAIIIDHGLGVFTGFWHLSEIDVQVGQHVQRGELVGLVGNTGLSTGAHLHWEMHVHGVAVNPVQWTQQAFP